MKKDPRQAALRSVRQLVVAVNALVSAMDAAEKGRGGPPRSPAVTARAAGVKSAKLKKSIKAHWASMSKQEREARIRRMLAARGLKPKPKSNKPPSAKSLALRKSIKAHWDHMTKAQRAARVKKMLAGRGLLPKAG